LTRYAATPINRQESFDGYRAAARLGEQERRSRMWPWLLAHGAGGDGSSWSASYTALKARRLETMMAEPLPLTSLATTSPRSNRRPSPGRKGPIVLAGTRLWPVPVISDGAPEPVRARSCDALAPDEGEGKVAECSTPATPSQAPKLAPHPDGQKRIDLAARRGLRERRSRKMHRDDRSGSRCRPAADFAGVASCSGRPSAWERRASWFLVSRGTPRMIGRKRRYLAARMKATITGRHDGDHTPSVTKPRGRRRHHTRAIARARH